MYIFMGLYLFVIMDEVSGRKLLAYYQRCYNSLEIFIIKKKIE